MRGEVAPATLERANDGAVLHQERSDRDTSSGREDGRAVSQGCGDGTELRREPDGQPNGQPNARLRSGFLHDSLHKSRPPQPERHDFARRARFHPFEDAHPAVCSSDSGTRGRAFESPQARHLLIESKRLPPFSILRRFAIWVRLGPKPPLPVAPQHEERIPRRRAYRDPGLLQVSACCFSTHTGGLLDAP